MNPSDRFEDFEKLIERLRKDCPWDRKQTHESLKDNLIEEAYEVVEAIDKGDDDELKKELGDLLLQVVFHSRIASERKAFTIDEVIYGISDKLIGRHPHVFGDEPADDERKIAGNWESIKLKEGKKSTLDGIPAHLPALIRAGRMQEKASHVGFDWAEWRLAWEKLTEEIEEWRDAVENQSRRRQTEEYGDLLFSLVNVGRLLNLPAEDALRQANGKFENRFRYVEEELKKKNRRLQESNIEEMDLLWEEAKRKGL